MKKTLLRSLLFVIFAGLSLTSFGQEALWGYSTTTDFSVAGSGGGYMQVAMWVPGDGELKGAKIAAVNLPFASDDATNISIWAVPSIEYAGTSLPAKTFEQKYSGKVKGNGYTRVDLKTPLSIPAEGFFIGYSFNTDYYYPYCTFDVEAKDGLWLYEDLFGRWYDYPELGASAMQLFVTGMKLDESNVGVLQVETRKCQKGSEVRAELTLVSSSSVPVQSIGYNVDINGAIQSGTATLAEPIPSGLNQFGTATISITAPAKAGVYEGLVNITAVNGEAYSDYSWTGFELDVRDELHQRISLVEEYTGTMCGNCTRGWLGMEDVHEKQSDRAVVVAVHQYNADDPMYNLNYQNLPWDGAPSCMLDRRAINIDPYYGEGNGIKATVDKYSAEDPDVDISLTAHYADASQTKVAASADVHFLNSQPGAKIAFVLTADGVSGTDKAWRQSNYLYENDPTGMGDLAIFCKGGIYGEGYVFLTYNDVLIGSTWQHQSDGSIKDTAPQLSPTSYGSHATASATVDITASKRLLAALDYGKVYLTAIVFNADGTVANAARCPVEKAEGIGPLQMESPESAASCAYDLQGRIQGSALWTEHPRGLYIQSGKKVIR